MTKVLMVCLGNICRSPMAEGLMRDYLAKNHSTSRNEKGTYSLRN